MPLFCEVIFMDTIYKAILLLKSFLPFMIINLKKTGAILKN